MEADGDKVNVATPVLPTPVTVVDNTAPTPVTVVDNSSTAPVIYANNYDPAAPTTNQPLPQKVAVKVSVNKDNTTSKAVQIAIGISDIDSVDLSISFDFSSLKIDSTTTENNPVAESNKTLLVPIGGESINPDGMDGGRISSGGGGETH
ncbi:hypothetical protein Hdeb2414_s0015g00452681 [Helianthus debilis subsp. tardiflorus]